MGNIFKKLIDHIIPCSTIIIVIAFFLVSLFMPIVANMLSLEPLPDHVYYIMIAASLVITLLILLPAPKPKAEVPLRTDILRTSSSAFSTISR